MKIELKLKVAAAAEVCELLAERTGLSRVKIKDALQKGALRVKGGRNKKWRRLRRAKASFNPGDLLEFHYDEAILAIIPPLPHLLADRTAYSVWFKPAGLLSQGTGYSDHCSLLRQAELHFVSRREVYLVHRLDREAEGVMVIAHDGKVAARLSTLFQEGKVEKRYEAVVVGRPDPLKGVIEIPLDGKAARSEYEVMAYDPETDRSTVRVRIETGRYHQIRRHMELAGHPVVGDPKYGKENKDLGGLRLKAVSLSFRCPLTGKDVCFEAA